MEEETLLPPPVSNPISGGIVTPSALTPPVNPITPLNQGPSGLVNPNPPVSPVDQVANSIQDYITSQKNTSKEFAPNTKVGMYDADYTGLNFQRYYNTPDVYSKLGFSPFRDNEQIYNNNMSWWDGWKRAAGQSLTQASVSFTGMLPWNALDGEHSDLEGARDVERAAAIGTDTRKNFGAWFNNTTLNSGFTFGILGEFALEELAFKAIGAIPGLQGVSAAGTANNLSKFLRNMGTVGKAFEVTMQGVRGLNDVSAARNFYKTFKAGNIARVVTPQGLEAVRDIYKGVQKGDALYSLANAGKAFGGFYRDVREINAALSESKIEAGSVEYGMKNKLQDEFYNKNGRMPNSKEAETLLSHAQAAGKETFLWNMPAIYLSNKLVFDKAIRGWLPTRVLRNQIGKGFVGKLIFNEAWKKTGTDPWSIINRSLKESAKMLTKPKLWKPKNLTKDFLGDLLWYTKANMSEGLQELYQESVAPAMEKYYTDKYNNPHVWGTKSKWGEFYEEGKKLVGSQQGLEIFGSGFVMGGFVQLPQKAMFQYIPNKWHALKNPEDYKAYIAQRTRNQKSILESLNYITKADPRKYFDLISQNASAQVNLDNEANMANQLGDRLGYMNVKDDAMFEHIHTLIASGKIDLLKDYISDMSKLSVRELEEAYGEVKPGEGNRDNFYQAKLEGFNKAIEDIERYHEVIDERFVNPFDYTKINKDDNEDEWLDTLINYNSYEAVKKMAIAANYHYGRTVERMDSIIQTFLKEPILRDLSSTDLSILFSSNTDPNNAQAGTLVSEIQQLEVEIKALATLEVKTPESKKSLKEKITKQERLQSYYEILTTRYLPLHKQLKEARAKGDQKEIAALEGALDTVSQDLKKQFDKYLLFVTNRAGINPDQISSVGPTGKRELSQYLNEAYAYLKDFYTLYGDRYDLVEAINILHNPDIVTRTAKMMATVNKANYANRQELLKKMFDAFQKFNDDNSIIEALSKVGVFFDPQFMEDFKKGDLSKIVFYYAAGEEYVNVNDLKEPTKSTVDANIKEILEKYQKSHEPTEVAGEIVVETPVEPTPPPPQAPKRLTITPRSSLIEMQPILPQLLDGYRKEEANRKAKGLDPLNIDWETMTDQDILKTEGFRVSMLSNISVPIINKYNEDEGLIMKSNFAAIRRTVTLEQRKILSEELGYTDQQISKMLYGDADWAITERIPGNTDEVRTKEIERIERERVEMLISEFYNEINRIEPDDPNAREKLFAWLEGVNHPARYEDYIHHGINSEIWDKMFADKLATLPVIIKLEPGRMYMIDGIIYRMKFSKDEVSHLEPYTDIGIDPKDKQGDLLIPNSKLNSMNIVGKDIVSTEIVITPEDIVLMDDSDIPEEMEEDNIREIPGEQPEEADDDVPFNPCE